MKKLVPVVELKLPILPNMELIATQTAEVIANHMDLSEEQSGEISMALIKPASMLLNIQRPKIMYLFTF